MHSAESAVVCWGIDRESHAMYFRDCVSGKWHPDELYEKIFEMVVKFNAFVLGVEVTSLEDFIVQPIKNMMRVKGIYPRFEALKAVGKKEDRVGTLVPHYRQGYVYHNKNVCTKYESQLMGFPRSKFWDVMDAAAYITKILEIYDYYFDPPPLEEDLDDEYKELEDENPMTYSEMI
jgi:predicted phage terminase large subunit-like protein